MTDQFGVIYGAALSVVLGAWSVYNASHPSRQNNVANLAIAAVLGVVMLLRFLIGGKVFPALVIVALSAGQIYRNFAYLK
ncbi:unnamed protein product [Adineta steineri]|uniref:Uncharacterized protein n=1 Tax=Adineta steineri TaxID=433720 RepID=A0A814ED69_9BILA|nr:unnamed protein product [Adineta steineri]